MPEYGTGTLITVVLVYLLFVGIVVRTSSSSSVPRRRVPFFVVMSLSCLFAFIVLVAFT